MREVRNNYFDFLYEHRLRVKIQEDLFVLAPKETKSLGEALNADLDGYDGLLSSAFASFANAVVADILIGRRLHLSNYLSDLAISAERLINLIEEPSEISKDYPLVHYQLTSNWAKTKSGVSIDHIRALATHLRLLRADALRISADHPPQKRTAGRKSYAAVRKLLWSLWTIAMRTGVELSNKRSSREFKQFKAFATTGIGLAVYKGQEGLTSLKLPSDLSQKVHTALAWQERLVIPRLSWHLREAWKQQG